MKLKGSQTEKNILTAFAGESQARNKYSYFAGQASKDGYEQIAAVFLETADQERIHAKNLFKILEGGEALVSANFPAGIIGTTAVNLQQAADGENYETTEMYPGFAKIADEEGFKAAGALMRGIAVAEARHRDRYLELLGNIKADKVFSRSESRRWVCRKCGYVHNGKSAPGVCPVCGHPQAYFELDVRNY
jgi:rubrerythrin